MSEVVKRQQLANAIAPPMEKPEATISQLMKTMNIIEGRGGGFIFRLCEMGCDIQNWKTSTFPLPLMMVHRTFV